MTGRYILRVHCEDIPLAASGGIEGFAAGMIQGFRGTKPSEEIEVVVATGQKSAWTDRLGSGLHMIEIGRASNGTSRRWSAGVRKLGRRSSVAHDIRALARTRSLSRKSRKTELTIVDYFPYHRVKTYGKQRFLTLHDLRVFSSEFLDLPSQRLIQENVQQARAVFVSWRHPYGESLRRFSEFSSKFSEVPFPPMLDAKIRSRQPGDFLLYPAATSPHKNQRLLIDYAAAFPDAPPIVLVGPPLEPELTALRERARELGVEERITFGGMVDSAELERLYASCRALVMPSRFEAASGPVMEAFVRGVPVVSAAIASIRDQVAQAGGTVSWFDPLSVESLSAAVQRLQNNYAYYEVGALAGADWYGRLSWIDTARAYLDVIDAKVSTPGM